MTLTVQQRDALTILADMGPHGCLEGVMLVHGIGSDVIADLIRSGLVSATRIAAARSGSRAISVSKIKITDAGRQALMPIPATSRAP